MEHLFFRRAMFPFVPQPFGKLANPPLNSFKNSLVRLGIRAVRILHDPVLHLLSIRESFLPGVTGHVDDDVRRVASFLVALLEVNPSAE